MSWGMIFDKKKLLAPSYWLPAKGGAAHMAVARVCDPLPIEFGFGIGIGIGIG